MIRWLRHRLGWFTAEEWRYRTRIRITREGEFVFDCTLEDARCCAALSGAELDKDPTTFRFDT